MGGGDAFSTRVTFTNLLKELSARHASNQAVGKVGNYAHKHRDQAEVLYACILEAMQEDKVITRRDSPTRTSADGLMVMIEPTDLHEHLLGARLHLSEW